MIVIARYTVREALRKRVFAVIGILTLVFLALYGLGTNAVFNEVEGRELIGGDLIEEKALVGGTLTGLAMFSILFLAVVLAVFLTMGTVRADAERGLLQPLVVRPVDRSTIVAGRFLAAAGVCAIYICLTYGAVLLLTNAVGDWWPDHIVTPGLCLVAGVAIMIAISLLGSVHLSSSANGIAVFMLFGAGLTAGLLGQIGEAINSDSLDQIADAATWALPFEALYQAGLHEITAETSGLTGDAIELGPFGGSEAGSPALVLWSLAYLGVVGALVLRGFARRDL